MKFRKTFLYLYEYLHTVEPHQFKLQYTRVENLNKSNITSINTNCSSKLLLSVIQFEHTFGILKSRYVRKLKLKEKEHDSEFCLIRHNHNAHPQIKRSFN